LSAVLHAAIYFQNGGGVDAKSLAAAFGGGVQACAESSCYLVTLTWSIRSAASAGRDKEIQFSRRKEQN